MSTQLVLYPQYYAGQFNAISIDPNEFVANGINFANLNSGSSYSSGSLNTIQDSLTNQPPTVVNTWYRFRSTTGTAPAMPVVSAGTIILNSVSVPLGCLSGVYQRLSGLTIGQSYTIKVKLVAAGTGTVYLGAFNGTSIVSNTGFSASSVVITDTFIANATDNTVVISYLNNLATNIGVSQISVFPTGNQPTATSWDLSNGQVICDLYEEEDLPLTLSVDDFKNVAEQVQSYSKAFKLPGTKRNNKLFDNIFEITRSTEGLAFNPYLKTQCVLKQNGFVLFEGYLRLIDIQDKMGEISYNVNLYSEVVALADVLGERTFSMLDFTELTHSYDKTNIKNSWNNTAPGISYTEASTSGYRSDTDTLKYPFVDWTHQILIADGFTGSSATLGRPELTDLRQAFRPFIQVKYLIDRIFQATPFSYTSTFFETTDFKKLYMDFNWGEQELGRTGVACGDAKTSLATWAFVNMQECPELPDTDRVHASELGFNPANSEFTCPLNNTVYHFGYTFSFEAPLVGNHVYYRWRLIHAGGGFTDMEQWDFATTAGTNWYWSGNFNITLQAGDILVPQFRTQTAGTVEQWGTAIKLRIEENPTDITSNTLLQSLRGELGQWDFLKGIFTMFNLVSMPDKEDKNNILIETYNDTFIENTDSKRWDWTDKVDISQIKLTPLTNLNKKTIFKFVEDEDDYAFMNYKRSVFGHLYGSKVYDASGFTILEGEEEIVAEPFAATVPKPLDSQFPQFVTPSIYAYNYDEGTTSGFDNSPRIMYNNGIKDTNTTYYIPAFNYLSSENQNEFLQFTHLSEAVPTTVTTQDFHFGECQLIQPIGNAVTDNLFNTYWLPYYNELYNPDTRTMSIKVNLSPGDITNFRFYDTVMIKNREYRVNKIDYKPNSLATVEFILIP